MRQVFAQSMVLLFLLGACASPVSAATADSAFAPLCSSALANDIPRRPHEAVGATTFIADTRRLDGDAREAAIRDQLNVGNVPDFLRHLHAVTFKSDATKAVPAEVTLCVTPDYLAIGSNRDFIRVPMGLATAVSVARRFGFALPTTKIVDAIYVQAEGHLTPAPMTPGPQMTSTDYFVRHNRTVERQRSSEGIALGSLLAGHKKDLVLTGRLNRKPGRVAIYGWHRRGGKPIQPLSTVHGAKYADYSHGVRLISVTAYVNGQARSLFEVLQDPELAPLISSEGPMRAAVRGAFSRHHPAPHSFQDASG